MQKIAIVKYLKRGDIVMFQELQQLEYSEPVAQNEKEAEAR